MTRLARSLVLLTLFLAGMSVQPSSAQQLPGQPQSLPTEPLAIVTSSGRHEFAVEVADDRRERAIGLMFRTSIGADQGMLFDYPEVKEVSMWMRNTYIPLDMLFIRADGTIANVAHDTTPLSLESISSDGAVRGVLELAAGTAARLDIQAGDKVIQRIFGNTGEDKQ